MTTTLKLRKDHTIVRGGFAGYAGRPLLYVGRVRGWLAFRVVGLSDTQFISPEQFAAQVADGSTEADV